MLLPHVALTSLSRLTDHLVMMVSLLSRELLCWNGRTRRITLGHCSNRGDNDISRSITFDVRSHSHNLF